MAGSQGSEEAKAKRRQKRNQAQEREIKEHNERSKKLSAQVADQQKLLESLLTEREHLQTADAALGLKLEASQ